MRNVTLKLLNTHGVRSRPIRSSPDANFWGVFSRSTCFLLVPPVWRVIIRWHSQYQNFTFSKYGFVQVEKKKKSELSAGTPTLTKCIFLTKMFQRDLKVRTESPECDFLSVSWICPLLSNYRRYWILSIFLCILRNRKLINHVWIQVPMFWAVSISQTTPKAPIWPLKAISKDFLVRKKSKFHSEKTPKRSPSDAIYCHLASDGDRIIGDLSRSPSFKIPYFLGEMVYLPGD